MIKQIEIHGQCFELYSPDDGRTWSSSPQSIVAYRRRKKMLRLELQKMTTADKGIKTKVGILELGKQLGNVSKACRIMGDSRDSFYRFKELYETGGEAAPGGDIAPQTESEEPDRRGQ